MSSAPRAGLFVDSDNALGAPRGDVDDGIALAVLLSSGVRVDAIASVFGNASADAARADSAALAAVCGYAVPCLLGAACAGQGDTEAARALASAPDGTTILGLGPLTNVASALALRPSLAAASAGLICLGSNYASRGRWPPVWPFEFNFTKDRDALVRTFASALPITIVPLDQAGRLRLRFEALSDLEGVVGDHVRRHARRWWKRARRLKLRRTAPVWDLVAVAYALWPERFRTERVVARAHDSGWVEYGAGQREVTVIVDYDPHEIWRDSAALVTAAASRTAVASAAPDPRAARGATARVRG